MQAALKNDVIAYFESERGAGKLLEGAQSIVSGPVGPRSVPSNAHPAISVYAPAAEYGFGGSGSATDLDLVVEVYTQEIDERGPAEDAILRLVRSDDGRKGVIEALKRMKSYTNDAGQTFTLDLSRRIRVEYVFGDATSDGFTFAARIPLRFKTIE